MEEMGSQAPGIVIIVRIVHIVSIVNIVNIINISSAKELKCRHPRNENHLNSDLGPPWVTKSFTTLTMTMKNNSRQMIRMESR